MWTALIFIISKIRVDTKSRNNYLKVFFYTWSKEGSSYEYQVIFEI